MADGNAVAVEEEVPGVGQAYPFPIMFPGSELALPPSKGWGLCDDEMWDSRTGALYWRSYQSFVKLTRNAVSLALEIAPGQEIDFFQAGQEEPAPASANYPAGYELTRADTEAYAEGALVRNERARFLIYAFGFSMGRPVGFTGTGATSTRVVSPWMAAYRDIIAEIIPDLFGIAVKWPDTKCEYDLGVLSQWGAHSAVISANVPQIGAGMGFEEIAPVRRPILAGYRTTEDRVHIKIENGMGLQIDNDVASPTVTDLYVPIRCIAYGVEACEDPCIVCVPDSVDVRQIVADETRKQLQAANARRSLALRRR